MKYDKALPLAKMWKCARKLPNDIFALQSKQNVNQSLLIT